MPTPNRKYSTSDMAMLTTAATIVENATANKTFLITKRSNWADPYFANLLASINTAVQIYIGADSAKTLRNATQALQAIQKTALDSLSEFNVQILQDFKKEATRKNEILNTLGFKDYYKNAATNKSQEALISLLLQFKNNMDAALKTEIISKGTAASTIDAIMGFANALHNANVTQETFKSNRPAITAAAINTFNNIYDEVIAVGKISGTFFKTDKAVKESFSFSKLTTAQKAAAPPKAKKAATTSKPPTI